MIKEDEKKFGYDGYFLMDSGLKINFNFLEDSVFTGELLYDYLFNDGEYPFEKGEKFWLGEEKDLFVLADKIVGFTVSEYEI